MSLEMSPHIPSSSQEIQEASKDSLKPPFEIRAHRLFSSLFQPALFGVTGESWVKNRIAESTRAIKFRRGYGLTQEYADDVLGPNPTLTTVSQHNKEIFSFMKEFLELPGDATIKLTRTPDNVCSMCAIGKHCTDRSHEFNPDQKYESNDLSAMEEFIGVIKWLGGSEGIDYNLKLGSRRKKLELENIQTSKKTLESFINNAEKYRKWKWQNDYESEEYLDE